MHSPHLLSLFRIVSDPLIRDSLISRFQTVYIQPLNKEVDSLLLLDGKRKAIELELKALLDGRYEDFIDSGNDVGEDASNEEGVTCEEEGNSSPWELSPAPQASSQETDSTALPRQPNPTGELMNLEQFSNGSLLHRLLAVALQLVTEHADKSLVGLEILPKPVLEKLTLLRALSVERIIRWTYWQCNMKLYVFLIL